MTNMNMYQRGWVEFTPETYQRLSRYLKKMPQFGIEAEFYTGYPIKRTDAQDDAIVRNGERQALCFTTHLKLTRVT